MITVQCLDTGYNTGELEMSGLDRKKKGGGIKCLVFTLKQNRRVEF